MVNLKDNKEIDLSGYEQFVKEKTKREKLEKQERLNEHPGYQILLTNPGVNVIANELNVSIQEVLELAAGVSGIVSAIANHERDSVIGPHGAFDIAQQIAPHLKVDANDLMGIHENPKTPQLLWVDFLRRAWNNTMHGPIFRESLNWDTEQFLAKNAKKG